ncbi:hypothetical protein C5614_27705 [Massilia phosphatilytica]|nr:hypothetical protein C5614_27705 [Massilia phosphatilytica]
MGDSYGGDGGHGGAGGTNTGGAGGSLASITAGYGVGGAGGSASGGNGGTNSVNAGTFDLSNKMTGTGQSAAGVLVVSQNSGLSSLIQQSVNVQSNLALGH